MVRPIDSFDLTFPKISALGDVSWEIQGNKKVKIFSICNARGATTPLIPAAINVRCGARPRGEQPDDGAAEEEGEAAAEADRGGRHPEAVLRPALPERDADSGDFSPGEDSPPGHSQQAAESSREEVTKRFLTMNNVDL